MWTTLWKLHVIPRVRVSWWRVLHGILPDSATLYHIHIKPTSLCEVCKTMNEDLLPALVLCNHAQGFWRVAHDRFKLRLPQLNPTTWAKDILLDHMFSDEDRCKVISIMHAIWTSRNRCGAHSEVGA